MYGVRVDDGVGDIGVAVIRDIVVIGVIDVVLSCCLLWYCCCRYRVCCWCCCVCVSAYVVH